MCHIIRDVNITFACYMSPYEHPNSYHTGKFSTDAMWLFYDFLKCSPGL
jgi:hypothetical protein